ncbi:iron ABC transporter permease [Paenibacillus sambharensis]|uniref:Iron ABC transporter permease n=1 Tax=Paenibacillus sambharensis TaxID=1803190 RepID=A0A2W1L6J8_9BACL|nr:iron ABC transporter permease [Paenibacillus sambharensis]
MNRSLPAYLTVLGALSALLVVVVYVSLTNGSFDLAAWDVLKTLLRLQANPDYDLVIFDFRLPRIVVGLLVGLGLGIAGAVIQGITRNGLADPGILGINAGAGAAVVLFMLVFAGQIKGAGWLSVMAMPLFGLVGGIGTAALIFFFAWHRGVLDPQRLILSGIALGSGLGALAMYISLKMNPQDFEMAAVWMAGSIYNANWRFVLAVLPWLLVLIPVIWSKSRQLDLLQLGRTTAAGVGVAVHKETNLLLLCSVGIVSACVSVSGSIGFVGLLSPHLARGLSGHSHSRVIPLSGLIGMLLVTASDFIGRQLFAPVTLPAGIVIAIIGAPYFVYLLFRGQR